MWVPSHTGILGNERADSLAKLDTAVDALESPYLPLRLLFSSRGTVSHTIMETWSTNWAAFSDCHMTKDFLPHPNLAGSDHYLSLTALHLPSILPSLPATTIFGITAVFGNLTLLSFVASATYPPRPQRTSMRSAPALPLFALPLLAPSPFPTYLPPGLLTNCLPSYNTPQFPPRWMTPTLYLLLLIG